MLEYRTIVDLLDQQNSKQLLVTIFNLNPENSYLLMPLIKQLNNSQLTFDIYINLPISNQQQTIAQQTLELINIFPNNLLITVANYQDYQLLKMIVQLSKIRQKKYGLLLKIDITKNINLEGSILNRAINIFNNRQDLSILGLNCIPDFLDNEQQEQLENYFQFTINQNPYHLKQQVLIDFIAEYYGRDINDSIKILEHHIKVNNKFTCFESFDIPVHNSNHNCQNNHNSKTILKQLLSLLKATESLPCSSQLIEKIYQQLNIPMFLEISESTIIYRLNSNSLIFDNIIEKNISKSTQFLDRAIAIHLYQNNNWIGYIRSGQTIKPISIVACHFKDNHPLRYQHLKMIQDLSQTTIIVYSSESGIDIDLNQLKFDNNNIFINDQDNNGLDLAKWKIGLTKLNLEPNIFDWIWLTNDSWFSCKNVNDWLDYYAARFDLGLIGLTSSLEGHYHLQSYSWLLNGQYLSRFLNWNQYNQLSYQNIVERNEIGFCQYLLSRSIKIDSYYNWLPFYKLNIFSQHKLLYQLIKQFRFALVKWRFYNEEYQKQLKLNFGDCYLLL